MSDNMSVFLCYHDATCFFVAKARQATLCLHRMSFAKIDLSYGKDADGVRYIRITYILHSHDNGFYKDSVFFFRQGKLEKNDLLSTWVLRRENSK